MKRFILRFLIFLIPFVALLLLEVFVLPIDFFTFRAWEALKIETLRGILPGYFYPRTKLTKVEEGDLAHHSPYAVKRKVEWKTDRRGYRNSTEAEQCRVVVMGDSNTVGSGLTQADTLPEALGRELGMGVYGLAPASPNTLLKTEWFIDSAPPVVIVAAIERQITSLRSVKRELASPSSIQKLFIRAQCSITENAVLQGLATPLDRALKTTMLHYSRAVLRRAIAPQPRTQVGKGEGKNIVFLPANLFGRDVPRSLLDRSVEMIASYRDLFAKQGIRFIFLPIPDKENIYYDLVPLAKQPVFLSELIPALRAKGVETVDIEGVYRETYWEKGPVLYQSDDSHWSAEGVRIAARAVMETMARKGSSGGTVLKTP